MQLLTIMNKYCNIEIDRYQYLNLIKSHLHFSEIQFNKESTYG